MSIIVREFNKKDIRDTILIWNSVVEKGNAFPQMDFLDEAEGIEFFESQSYTAVAVDEKSGEIAGVYILHPNNIGRCAHICNASYAVKENLRGRHIGEKLVVHSLKMAKELGFAILQFNAVVKSNKPALALYEKLGFVKLGEIPGGFLMKNGTYENIVPHYHIL